MQSSKRNRRNKAAPIVKLGKAIVIHHVTAFVAQLLPVPLLLPGLVGVKSTCVRAALRVADVTLRTLTLRLVLLGLLALWDGGRTASEALSAIEASLSGLLDAASGLRTLPNTSLSDANTHSRSNILHTDITAVGLVHRFR